MTIDRLAEYCSLTGPANQSPSDGRWTRGKWTCRHRLLRRIAPERQKARPKNKHGCRVSQLTRRADDTAWWCFIAEEKASGRPDGGDYRMDTRSVGKTQRYERRKKIWESVLVRVRTGIVSWRTDHSLCRVSTTPTALRIHPPVGNVRLIFNKPNGKEVTPPFLLVFQPKVQS